MTFRALKLAALAIVAMPGMAQAAVTYSFVAAPAAGASTSGGFSFTVDDPIVPNATIASGDLTSCSVINAHDPLATCGDQKFQFDSGTSRDIVLFRWTSPDQGGTISISYYFGADAFSTNGVHNAQVATGGQPAMLTVSGIVPAPPAVPEPASWALMIGGLGLAGAALRRRPAASFTTA